MSETIALRELPFHRWLSFSDSWPATSVERLLDAAKTDLTDVIYDPFVGCGTTPVVCAQKGMRTVSCDVSTLAIAATRTKLAPPCKQDLDGLERAIDRLKAEELLKCFADRTLAGRISGANLRLLQFVLAAVLIRLGWHEGNALSLADVRDEIARLMSEIRADISTPLYPLQPHRLFCSDFLAIDPGYITRPAVGRLVLLSSPPFFGSNVNPAEQRLAALLDEPVRKATPVRRAPIWSVPEAEPILEAFRDTGETSDEVADYLFFLDRIVTHAVDIRCRCVAVEMGPKNINACEVRFDMFLAQRLRAHNYQIDLFETAETEPEICTFVCAHENGT